MAYNFDLNKVSKITHNRILLYSYYIITIVFHNCCTYDYNFVIKELVGEFEGEFECLGENTEKYITFSVPMKKEITKIDKYGNDKIMKISCKIKIIDS